MTEADLWKKIRRVWPGHAMRIEASEGGCEPGTPDSILSVGGRGMFVELKVWPEELRPLQLPWHIDAVQRGAGAEVWCWVGEGRVWRGTAEEYQVHLDQKRKPTGSRLEATVGYAVRVLQGKSSVV